MGGMLPPQRGACGGGTDVRSSRRACSAPRLRMLAFWGKHATRLSPRSDGWHAPPQRGACGGGIDVRTSHRACSAPRLRMLAFWGKHATRLSRRSDGWHAPPSKGSMWRRYRRQNVSSRVFGAATSHACLLGQACHPMAIVALGSVGAARHRARRLTRPGRRRVRGRTPHCCVADSLRCPQRRVRARRDGRRAPYRR